MASATDIANHANDLLGDNAITDLDESNSRVQRLKRAFERSRDQLQRLYAWTQFMERTTLSKDATAPEWGFSARFLKPSECLRVVDVYIGGNSYSGFYPEGNYIFSNDDGPLQVRYLKRNTDIGAWDPLFNQALAYRMAIGIIESVNQSTSKKQTLLMEYQKAIHEARMANAWEVEITPVNDPSLLEQVRIGSVGSIAQSRF